MKTKVFDVHGVKIRIESSSQRLHNDIMHQLAFFETSATKYDIDNVQINIQDYAKKPHIKSVQIASNKYYYFEGFLDIPKQSLCFNLESETHRYYLDSFQIPVNLIVQLYLQNIGKTLVHSAGVCLNDKTLLFPALSGIGKTTIVAYAMNNSGKIYGDDMCIVDKNGLLYPYPIDFSVYDYHYNLLGIRKSYKSKVSSVLRAALMPCDGIPLVSSITKKIISKFFPPSQNISPVKVYGKDRVANASTIMRITYINRHLNSKDLITYEKLSKNEMSKRITSALLFEWRHSVEFLKIYSAFSNQFCFLDMCNSINNIFSSVISTTEVSSISIDASLENKQYLEVLKSNKFI